MDVNENGLTFEAWMAQVDKVLLRVCGLTAGDLADYPSYDNWADGLAPVEAAFVCAVEWNDMPEDLFWAGAGT